MTISGFEAFCKDFCALARIEPCGLRIDVQGFASFGVRARGAHATILWNPERADSAYMLVDLGTMPPERGPQGWHALLETNLVLLGIDSPVFACNPTTGAIVLHQCTRIGGICAGEAFERFQALIDLAVRWRDDGLIADPGVTASGGGRIAFAGMAA